MWAESRSNQPLLPRSSRKKAEVIDLDSSPANHVSSYATEEFLAFLARQGIPFEQFRAQRQPASIAHNQGETPFFAASIERAVLNN